MTKATSGAAGVSDAAVQKATGKTWPEWFKLLDAAGAKTMTHKEIVAVLVEQHGVGPWWQQMVTVGYEQARGLREKHQKTDGYSVSRSKTLNVPVSRAFRAWKDAKLRAAWLAEDGIVIRKATTNRSLRITWSDAKTSVEVMFYPKGESKVQVTVQHNKLASAAAGDRLKKFWGAALDRLAAELVE
jgi:uncharacterized protein YndB with AHSA1/START domain